MDARNRWNSVKIRLEPENVLDRFAVAVEKEVQIVGHLNKENSGRLVKVSVFFLDLAKM